MKYILFGCGHAGAEAMLMLGKNNIECFCDNSCKASVMSLQEVPVISFETFLNKYHDYVIVITANEKNGIEISNQLESRGIYDYVFYYDEVKELLFQYSQAEVNSILTDINNRLRIKSDHLYKSLTEKRKQIEFLSYEISPKDICKEYGFIRSEQKRSLDLAKEILEVIKKLKINVFAVGGTLIGAVRHKGFIPWDDDIDFGIMRQDLYKLIDYISNVSYCYERHKSGIGNYEALNDALINNPGKFIIEKSAYCLSIIKGTSITDYSIIDFFSFDYFDNAIDFDDYKKSILCTKKKIEETNDELERLIIENKAVDKNKHICFDSSKVFFSLDSMMAYDHLHCDNWITTDEIFPIRYYEFEDFLMPVPNMAEAFLKKDIPSYESIPDDVGIAHRIIQRNRYIRSILPSVELYISDYEEVEAFYHIYRDLKSNGIYAIYVVEKSNIIKHCNCFNEIKNKLINLQVEYNDTPNTNSDLGVVFGLPENIKNIYKNVYYIDKQNLNYEEIHKYIIDILKGSLSG